MSKSSPSCYNGPMKTLCCARRKWQGNDGQRNKMERVRCFHSPADYSPAQFPSDHWRFIPDFPVEIVLPGLKEVQKHFGIPEKFRAFFEKYCHFNVKFRNFFGFYFLENNGHGERGHQSGFHSVGLPGRPASRSVTVCNSDFGTTETSRQTNAAVCRHAAAPARNRSNLNRRIYRMGKASCAVVCVFSVVGGELSFVFGFARLVECFAADTPAYSHIFPESSRSAGRQGCAPFWTQ
jgi:hypothetical protein